MKEAANRVKELVGMAKRHANLVGASVTLLASLVALLLVQLRENENALHYQGQGAFIWESWFGDFLILFALWVAVLASLALAAAALFVRAPRQRAVINGGVRPNPARQYQTAVETAWADKELNETERRWLSRLEGELGLSRDRAEQIERKVMMGRTRGDIVSPEDKYVLQYRAAVKMAWADWRLSEAEAERLGALESELGLSQEKADDIEREIMGGVKEEIVAPEETALQEDDVDRYKLAVEMVWADEKLNKAEEERLGRLELDLAISGGRAEEIEREIMGDTREEVVSPDSEGEKDRAEEYRAAVAMAWADEKLSREERDLLSALEDELGLGYRAADIEREVMGETKGEIGLYEPPGRPEGEEPWVKLVEDCVGVVDELDRHMASLDPRYQELADHVIFRLGEVLERSGVDVISDDTAFDSRRHRPERASSRTSPGATVTETLSPGFAVGRRVLRRARVRVE